MLAYQIPAEGIKVWMNHLLREKTFDAFEVRGVGVTGLTRLDLDGVRYSATEAEAERTQYCTWGLLREDVFHFVKGRPKPSVLKVVFAYPQRALAAIHENAAALSLNFSFENEALVVTTAVSQKTFALDKAVDGAWDGHVAEWLGKLGLPLG